MTALDVVADAELLDECAVVVDVLLLDVLKQTATLTDEHHEATTSVVVLLMLLKVLGEVADTLRKNCDLNLSAAGVMLVLAELGDELCGALLADAVLVCHCSTFQLWRLLFVALSDDLRHL